MNEGLVYGKNNFKSVFKKRIKNVYKTEKFFLSFEEDLRGLEFEGLFSLYEKVKKYENIIDKEALFALKSIEEIYDFVELEVQKQKVNKFIKGLFSKKTKHLYSDGLFDVLFYYNSRNCLKDIEKFISPSIANFTNKTSEDYLAFVKNIIKKQSRFSKEEIKKNIISGESEILLETEDKLYVGVSSFEGSKKLGSKNWCISYEKIFYEDYSSEKINSFFSEDGILNNLNQFIFVFDFSKPLSDPEKLVGYTVDVNNKKILYALNESDKSIKEKDYKVLSLTPSIKLFYHEYKLKSEFKDIALKAINDFNQGVSNIFFDSYGIEEIVKVFKEEMQDNKNNDFNNFFIKINSFEDFIRVGGGNVNLDYFVFFRFNNEDVFKKCLYFIGGKYITKKQKSLNFLKIKKIDFFEIVKYLFTNQDVFSKNLFEKNKIHLFEYSVKIFPSLLEVVDKEFLVSFLEKTEVPIESLGYGKNFWLKKIKGSGLLTIKNKSNFDFLKDGFDKVNGEISVEKLRKIIDKFILNILDYNSLHKDILFRDKQFNFFSDYIISRILKGDDFEKIFPIKKEDVVHEICNPTEYFVNFALMSLPGYRRRLYNRNPKKDSVQGKVYISDYCIVEDCEEYISSILSSVLFDDVNFKDVKNIGFL